MFNVNVLIWIVISPLPFKVQEGNALPMTGYYDYTISIYGTLSIIVPLCVQSNVSVSVALKIPLGYVCVCNHSNCSMYIILVLCTDPLYMCTNSSKIYEACNDSIPVFL